ncbi:MAG: aldo/keto reductase [Gemmatimonadota bacterium]
MQTRFLGRTGVKVSPLCFGTMSFGGDADEAMSAKLFAACRDAGVNVFDCADVYNQGRSEEILGRLAAGCRDEVVLTSKVYFPAGPGHNAAGTNAYHIVRAVEGSLRRLGTDRIDVYFLHRFDDTVPLEETLRAIELLVQQGKVLYPAASNFAAWQTAKGLGIAERNGWARFACVQPMYNLVKRQAEVEILPLAAAEGLGVLPYSPLGGGLLTGKYGVERRPDSGRLLESRMYGRRYGEASNFEIAERFTAYARERGHSPAALAVAWVAAHPAVTAPIIGARSVDQLSDSLASMELRLAAEERSAISALSPTPAPATDRNDEGIDGGYGVRA